MSHFRLSLLALALAACAGSASAQQYHMRVFSKGVQAEAALPEIPPPPPTSAIGTLSGDPDFGVVVEGDTVARTFTFTNSGDAAASGVYAWLSNYPELSVLANSCGTSETPTTVGFSAGANTCEMRLSYAPSTGTSTLAGSSLEVAGNFTGSPQALLLTGTATPLTVSLAAATLPAGSRGTPYGGGGGGYDLKPLFSTNSQSPDPVPTWSVKTGILPQGLTLSAQGLVAGTPSASTAGASFTVAATYKNKIAQKAYTIVVNGSPMLASQIEATSQSACAIVNGAVYCWGDNNYGQLGTGGGDSLKPLPLPVLTSGVTKISLDGTGGCAIKDGAAYCWGTNSSGQIGDGTSTSRPTPVLVSGLTSGVTDISSGGSTRCAVHDGAAKCWGEDASGALGNGGTNSNSNVPSQVTGLTANVTQISADSNNTACAVHAGAAKCWGYNPSGQVGDGTTTSRSVPVAVTGLTSGVTKIDTGGQSACAIHNGAAKCWGSNWAGVVGNNSTLNTSSAVVANGLTSNVTDISVSGNSACAIQSGLAKCWGENPYGQVGDGTKTQRNVPTAVSGLSSGVSNISAGGSATCAIHSGIAKCWGNNSAGGLGNGNTTQRSTAVQVIL